MNRLFYKMPCLSISKTFNKKEIYEQFFDKKVDWRNIESYIQKFLILNKKAFNFLGIDTILNGADNNLTLSFETSNYIGAIPIKMPYDGIAHKDFQVVPKFDDEKNTFSELTQLLSCLEHSITPEYLEDYLLTLPFQLSPPLYYEAVKYIELFEKAYKNSWQKFDVIEGRHSYPKSSTNWDNYARASFDPRNTLVFRSRDSVLSTNHKEWQELRYVFDIARETIISSAVPSSIRFRYEGQLYSLNKKVSSITPRMTNLLNIHSSDPVCIKNAKSQANILLKKNTNICLAWRMDMAELFERYVQYVLEQSMSELSGTVICNEKIIGKGNIPYWGLRYLEPDIMIKIGDRIYMADVKYKSHFYAYNVNSNMLKETHRNDLHQLLAYCSYEPQYSKVGILFYPAHEMKYHIIRYSDRVAATCNRVILCGISFNIKEIKETSEKLKVLFQNEVMEI